MGLFEEAKERTLRQAQNNGLPFDQINAYCAQSGGLQHNFPALIIPIQTFAERLATNGFYTEVPGYSEKVANAADKQKVAEFDAAAGRFNAALKLGTDKAENLKAMAEALVVMARTVEGPAGETKMRSDLKKFLD